MTIPSEVAPYNWVELQTYIHEEFEDGLFRDWWNREFARNWNIDEDAGATEHRYAVRGSVGSDNLMPSGTRLTGDFTLDVRLQYGSTVASLVEFEVMDVSDDSRVCGVVLEQDKLSWIYDDPSTVESLDISGGKAYDRFWMRIERVGSVISAYWYDDFELTNEGTFSHDWTPFYNTVSSSADVYLSVTGSAAGGIAEMKLQAVAGFPQSVSPNAVVNGQVMDKCFHLGMKTTQGGGWSDVTGADWLWPCNQAGVVSAVDVNGYRRLCIWDRNDAIWYVANTKDGPPNSGLVWRNRDKVDPNVSGSGTHIPGKVKRRQDHGETRHYTMDHIETWVDIKPRKDANIDATGYDSDGQLTDQEFTARLYQDGSTTAGAEAIDIPLDREIVFDHKTPARTQQFEVETVTTDWRITGFEHYWSVYDIPQFPKKNSNDVKMLETINQESLRTPIFWVSRTHRTQGLNRATTRLVTGYANITSTATGPDGESNSAMVISITP